MKGWLAFTHTTGIRIQHSRDINSALSLVHIFFLTEKHVTLICFSKCPFCKSFADECLAVFDYKQQITFVRLYSNYVLVQFIA